MSSDLSAVMSEYDKVKTCLQAVLFPLSDLENYFGLNQFSNYMIFFLNIPLEVYFFKILTDLTSLFSIITSNVLSGVYFYCINH